MKSRNYRQQNKITTPKTSTIKLGTSNRIRYDVATEPKEHKQTIFWNRIFRLKINAVRFKPRTFAVPGVFVTSRPRRNESVTETQ